MGANNISCLHNISFIGYPLIIDLELNTNDVKFIETGAFYPLKLLSSLILFNNKNLHLPNSNIFMLSSELSFLSLAGCSLSSFPNDTFRWLPKLEKIGLSNNNLRAFNITHCPKEARLNVVGLNSNLLYFLTNETFSFTCKCSTFGFRYNVLKLVDPFVVSRIQATTLLIGPYTIPLNSSTSCR